jgi:hypothetical protein
MCHQPKQSKMDSTLPSVATANIEVRHVTSLWDSARRTSGAPTDAAGTQSFLTYGSLLQDRYGLDPTATRQLSPWTRCSAGQALQQAMEDVLDTLVTPISGDSVILVFATPAWRLLITMSNNEMPVPQAGERFVFAQPETIRFCSAKLLAQPQSGAETNSTVLRAWRAAVPAADVEATSQFLYTALQLAQLHSTTGSKASR